MTCEQDWKRLTPRTIANGNAWALFPFGSGGSPDHGCVVSDDVLVSYRVRGVSGARCQTLFLVSKTKSDTIPTVFGGRFMGDLRSRY